MLLHAWCTVKGHQIIVRLVGSESDIIDKDLESAAFQAAAKAGLGARLLAKFKNGRCEQFLTGYR